MASGKILVAKKNGVYVLKFVGDVRLTLCTALDVFLDQLIQETGIKSVFIDLCDTDNIDSTALGFMAKIAILTKKEFGWVPRVISDNPDITRLLMSMGFDEIFTIIEQRLDDEGALAALPECVSSEEEVKGKVVEAHKILMGLNAQNKLRFEELVTLLEAS